MEQNKIFEEIMAEIFSVWKKKNLQHQVSQKTSLRKNKELSNVSMWINKYFLAIDMKANISLYSVTLQ